MTGKDVLNGLTPFFFSVAALFGLLLISFVVQSLMRNTKTKSLTDLKSLAQSYVSFSDNDDSSRAKSFSAGKRKSCISCVNFRLGAYTYLRVDPASPMGMQNSY